MTKIDLTMYPDRLERTVQRVRERNIIIPTFEQMRNPSLVPEKIKEELKGIGLWDIHPRNLFRITWHNEPKVSGGLFGGLNYLEFPESLTGTPARIVGLVGKWMPTGSHKVGAAFACLVPRLVTGQFDPTYQKAVWPSTGNYCRGGAYDSALLACESIAILPEEMSQERFEWLANVAGEVIRTPGSESNVKEIFDKTWELRKSDPDVMIFNQFDEFGNYLWHYDITGHAIEELVNEIAGPGDAYRGLISATGSAGTIASGDYMKQLYPSSFIAAVETLQCPTLLLNGFGAHRVEGIGDKHVPWIHNIANTDFIIAVDDNAVMNLTRLFNEPEGKAYLVKEGISEDLVENLDLLGLSSTINLLSAIKVAKYLELTKNDIIVTMLTDSMELYESRLEELHAEVGQYSEKAAAIDDARWLKGVTTDYMEELTYMGKKRVHNLKYYTWVEQQGKTYEEIQDMWYQRDYWTELQAQIPEIDAKIKEFNERVGLL
ncbi:MAG TPA: pyridoxal-phosphate dependent enzyme [Brevefilum fermentans]|jgi:cysteine synthase|nr:pyridoxal-phosphate dependent enzyme [Chloroflexota bacterium]OQB87979.1 MAG: Cysteine synthase [Chloroflexi bacterium ADurb.Bin120]HOM67535.1 pyridoxal-phosphate dependent enzyme [Brevefilum fermentans]HPX95513.1 pyridoxal-phosphate dependent enzyme [Brevefilum fermentans]HQA27625.1 pyridoxal-phosphate dependent enzyme [Brevefilum fermentans]